MTKILKIFLYKIIFILCKYKMSYKCISCDYKTKFFSDMKKHIGLKKSCIKTLSDSFKYTVDQTIILSLIPYNDINKQNIDDNKIKNIKYINENKQLLLDILSIIDKNKQKVCSFCSTKFNKIQDLREHVLLECFTKEMSKKHNVINTQDTYNITNNITNNINNNITNIIINLAPLSFDKNWSLEEITEFKTKYDILQSDIMYTSLLQKILENKLNLNVIIDKTKNIGFIYKNENEKYVKTDINEITENSMEKLRENLLELNNNMNSNPANFKDTIKFNEDRINNKLNDYKLKPEIKKKVDVFIADMFDKKKVDAYDISKNVETLTELGY